jgi:hypothetical protein
LYRIAQAASQQQLAIKASLCQNDNLFIPRDRLAVLCFYYVQKSAILRKIPLFCFPEFESMNKSFWQKAWPHLAAIGIFLVLSVFYCKPVLQGKALEQGDVTHWKGMAQQSFEYKEKYGHLPLWTNSTFGGMPAYQIAMEDAYKFSPSVFYLHYVFTLWLPKPINFFFLACLMMYFLLVVLRVNPWIGVLGAISYAWSTYDPVIISVGHDTKMMCIAYAPAILGGLFLLFKKQYLWGTLALTVFAGLSIANSHMQIVYYTFIIALFAGIGFLIHTLKKGDTRHAIITVVLAGISGLAAIAMNLTAIAPLNEFTKETMRGGRSELTDTTNPKNKTVGGLDKSYAFEYSYGKAETFTLIVPGIYGGGHNGQQLSSDSKFAAKLVDVFHAPEDRALQSANASSYWGDQPILSGPVYLGAIICFLFILGMVLLNDWNKWWLLAVSVFGILLAWGGNFQAFNYFLFDHLPYYNKFRAPSMALFIPQVGFVIMAALTLQEVFFGSLSKEELWKKLQRGGIITGALLLLLVLMYFSFDYSSHNDARVKESYAGYVMQGLSQGQQPTPQMQQQAEEVVKGMMNGLRDDRRSLYFTDLVRCIVLIGLAFGLLWAYAKDKLKREYTLAGILLLGSFDLVQIDRRYLNDDNYIEAEQNDNPFTPSTADQMISRDTGYYRVLDQTGGNPFVDSRASYFHNSLGGYSPAKLGLYQDIIERQLNKGNMHVFNMLNTKYFIVQDQTSGQPVAQKNPDALGPAWFVKTLVFARDADDEMHILDKLNTRDSAVVDLRFKSIASSQPVYDSTATITLQKNMNDSVIYISNAPTPQFAVFSEIYYPHGWDAYIDGQKADYGRVDYILRGMPVPAGKHTIEFKFLPKTYYTGSKISLWTNILVCILLLAGIGITLRKKKA